MDDAAVFPPGLASWPDAVTAHSAYRHSTWSAAIGPLLVPVDGVDGLLAALDGVPGLPVPLEVGLVSRPGAAAAGSARRALEDGGRVRVVAVELPLVPHDDVAGTWGALANGGVAVWWELDPGTDLDPQLDAVAAARPRPGAGGAKLRTGGSDAAAVASAHLLAGFLTGCAARGLPFKLTAGLHHALRGPDPVTGGVTHGVLNVLHATRAAARGGDARTVAEALERTDAARLAAEVRAWTRTDRQQVRAAWASFGCCGVLDPLGELDDLGVGRSLLPQRA